MYIISAVFVLTGPDLWGIINPTWRLCSSGKHQSPIDINPRSLVYDQNLQELAIDDFRVSEFQIASSEIRIVILIMFWIEIGGVTSDKFIYHIYLLLIQGTNATVQ